jgi:hypothetical protein
MTTQPKNLLALLIGAGQFSFADGATSAAGAQAAGYRDFGNCVVFSLQAQGQKKEHIGSDNGIRKIDKTIITEIQVGYQFKFDEVGALNMRYHLYGTPGSKLTQTSKSAVAIDAVASPVKGVWYDVLVAGVRVREITTLAFVTTPSVVENTDVVIDYKTGRYRYITTPPGTITSISVTAPAIVATDATSLTPITPGNNPIRRGFGRVICYDTEGNFSFEHEAFYCEIYPESNPDFDGQKNTELTINARVTDPIGKVNFVQP